MYIYEVVGGALELRFSWQKMRLLHNKAFGSFLNLRPSLVLFSCWLTLCRILTNICNPVSWQEQMRRSVVKESDQHADSASCRAPPLPLFCSVRHRALCSQQPPLFNLHLKLSADAPSRAARRGEAFQGHFLWQDWIHYFPPEIFWWTTLMKDVWLNYS